MADPRQVQEWLAGLEKERTSKIGETSGVGDILNLLGLLKAPGTTAALQGADFMDRIAPPRKPENRTPAQKEMLMGIDEAPQLNAVVSPAVKKSRAAAISALQPSKNKRVDMIPRRLTTPELTRGEIKRRGVEDKDITKDDFYFINGKGSKKYEVLVDKIPKAGLTVRPGSEYPPRPELLYVDAAGRKNYEEILRHMEKVKEYKKAVSQREAMWDAKIKNPDAPTPPGDLPDYPPLDYRKVQKTDYDPAVIKQTSRALAALYPNQSRIGGDRTSGIRNKLGLKPFAEAPLPKLSETAAQKARSQVTKWLDEMINAKPKR